MNEKNDERQKLTQESDKGNIIFMSLNKPKTVKEIALITGLSAREIQRIMKRLIEQGKVRELTKTERYRMDWRPDTGVYSENYWDKHRTDRRIPVYIRNDSSDQVRKRIDEYLTRNLGEGTCGLVLDLINGRYKPLDPMYFPHERLEKLFALFQKCRQYSIAQRIENSILNVCESIRGRNEALELDIPFQPDDIQSKLIVLFIREAIGKGSDGLDETVRSIKDLSDSEINNAVGTLHNLIVRGGFSDLRKNKEIITDLVFDLTDRGIDREILEGLIEALGQKD